MHSQSKNVLQHASDPMCVPQLLPYDRGFRVKHESFAQAYKEHIDFVLSDPMINPMDPTTIY